MTKKIKPYHPPVFLHLQDDKHDFIWPYVHPVIYLIAIRQSNSSLCLHVFLDEGLEGIFSGLVAEHRQSGVSRWLNYSVHTT